MGTRSQNFLVLNRGIAINDELRPYLNSDSARHERRDGCSLYLFETNRSPSYARTQNHDCAFDLLMELALQRYLGTLLVGDFYLMRAGDECDFRGEFLAHPFADHPEVMDILSAFAAATQGQSTTAAEPVSVAAVVDLLTDAADTLMLTRHAMPVAIDELTEKLHGAAHALRENAVVVTLPLHVREPGGNVIDTTDCTLSLDAVADIVDQACEVALSHGDSIDSAEMGELIEALQSRGLISEYGGETEPTAATTSGEAMIDSMGYQDSMQDKKSARAAPYPVIARVRELLRTRGPGATARLAGHAYWLVDDTEELVSAPLWRPHEAEDFVIADENVRCQDDIVGQSADDLREFTSAAWVWLDTPELVVEDPAFLQAAYAKSHPKGVA